MNRPDTARALRRIAAALGLAGLLLTLPADLVMTGIVPALPDRMQERLGDFAGTLCAGQCTCSYCDQLINGRCYANGHLGPETCTTACGARRCLFRPNTDGCGPILYLGCDDAPCAGRTPAATRPPAPPLPPPPGMGPTPTPAGRRPPVPTAGPAPACNRTWVEVRPPALGAVWHEPPRPVLQAQEFAAGPDHGVTFHASVQGGRAIQYAQRTVRKCPTAGAYPADCPQNWIAVCETYVKADHNDPVIAVALTLDLQAASRHWIGSSLRSRYPRAHVRQGRHSPAPWTGRTMAATLAFPDWYPVDPGVYAGTVTARTGGTPISAPQTATKDHEVIVNLRDTTLAP